MKEKLKEICKNHILPTDIDVVIREPYIPHIPSDWNGILVLAESQSLPADDEDYANELREMSIDKKINRLNLDENSIAVGPWNDGSLKLAFESVYDGESSERTAVSNASPWSQRNTKGKYAVPNKKVQQRSTDIWKEMLEVMKPKLIICSGDFAEEVVDAAGWAGEKTKWRLPGRLRFTPTGELDPAEVLKCYPEVQKALGKGQFNGANKGMILFACNSVSRTLDGVTDDTYRAK